MARKGAEARRKRGPHDTETWRKRLEQVGVEYGASVSLLVPVYNAAQLGRAATVIETLARRMRQTLGFHRWEERAQVSRCVRLIHSARAELRLTNRG